MRSPIRPEQILFPLIRQVSARPWLSRALFGFDRWGDPNSEAATADPYPLFERMRADGPVNYRRLYQQWFVTGYDEVRTVLSSSEIRVQDQIDMLLSVRPYSQLSDRAKTFMSTWLVFVDPPRHSRLRRLVSKAFTPARVREMEPAVEELADQLLDRLAQSGPIEVVEPFCTQLPVTVIAKMLGLPVDRWEWSRRTTAEFVKLLSPFDYFAPGPMNEVIDEIFDYYQSLAADRLANPRDDLITALAEAQDDSDGQTDRLTTTELVTMIAFIMGAGHETTTNQLALGLYHLGRFDSERAKVLDDPSLWPNAVEELIRYDPPIKAVVRSPMNDIDVGGVTIPAKGNILVELSAANRDPRRFDEPNRLLVDRDDPAPISFGYGAHHCLGHALARLETRVGLQRFLDHYPDYRVDESSIVWRRSAVLRGLSRLILVP